MTLSDTVDTEFLVNGVTVFRGRNLTKRKVKAVTKKLNELLDIFERETSMVEVRQSFVKIRSTRRFK